MACKVKFGFPRLSRWRITPQKNFCMLFSPATDTTLSQKRAAGFAKLCATRLVNSPLNRAGSNINLAVAHRLPNQFTQF
jgi:hypothetical protein